MKLTRPKVHEAIIPTASMADIAFLLIIFFMVTTVYDLDRTNVTLPQAFNRVENEKGAAIVVIHQEDGNLVYKFSDGENPSQTVAGPSQISLEANRLAFQDSTKQFVLKADGDIRYELIDEMLDTLREAGASNVLLLAEAARSQE